MLTYLPPDVVRLLQAEREREIAQDRLAALARVARACC